MSVVHHGSLPPEVLEPVRRQLGVPHRVLDILVSHPGLDSPRIVTGIRQRVPAPMAQHVGVDGESPSKSANKPWRRSPSRAPRAMWRPVGRLHQ